MSKRLFSLLVIAYAVLAMALMVAPRSALSTSTNNFCAGCGNTTAQARPHGFPFAWLTYTRSTETAPATPSFKLVTTASTTLNKKYLLVDLAVYFGIGVLLTVVARTRGSHAHTGN